MYLVALLPPPNIQHVVEQIQSGVFREFSSAGALALPPCIPLGFYRSEPTPPAKIPIQEYKLESSGYSEVERHLYLRIAPEDEIDRIRTYIDPDASDPLLPLFPGIPVGIDLGETAKAAAAWPPPEIGWQTSRLVSFKLAIGMSEVWWRNVVYEVCFSAKLKRKT